MPKRLRNGLGRFVSKCSSDSEPSSLFDNFLKKTVKIFYVIALLAIICPLIVFIIKSQRIRALIYAIIHFYDEYFIGMDENGIKSKEENNGGYFSFK